MVLACVTVRSQPVPVRVGACTMRIPTQADGTTGHVWAHGVLREGCGRCRCGGWWYPLGAFLFGVVYLYRVSGLRQVSPASSPGASHGEQQRRRRRQQCAARGAHRVLAHARRRAARGESETQSASAIASISTIAPPATAAKAHGNHAVGAPDLTDADWLYGGDGDTILTSILDGRNGVMPPLGPALGHNGVNEVAVVCS